MRKFNKTGRSFVTVVAGAVVLAVFGTGTAIAGSMITSADIKNNTIKSKDVRNNNLKGVDVRDNALTGADIADGSLTNQDVGVLYASINSDGAVHGSSGGVTVLKSASLGRYEVFFPRNVSQCAFTATVGGTGHDFATGYANARDSEAGTNGVFVLAKTPEGVNADMDFHLTVVC